MTFTGTPQALRARLTKLEAAGTTGIIIGILPSFASLDRAPLGEATHPTSCA